MKQPSEKAAKKPYVAPKLFIYGSLTEMTKAAGRKSRIDGGGNPLKRRTGA